MKLVEVITEILKEVSPENAPYFEENKNSYEKELKELDDEFKDLSLIHILMTIGVTEFPAPLNAFAKIWLKLIAR